MTGYYSKSEPVKAPPGIPVARSGDQPQAAPKAIVVKEDAYLSRLAWSADGKTVATIGITFDVVEVTNSDGNNPRKVSVPEGTIKLWDASTGKLQHTLEKETHTDVRAFAFSPDKETVAMVSTARPHERNYDREIRLLDTKTWKVKQKVEDISFAGLFLHHVAFSPDGRRLALGGYQNGSCVKLWDLQQQKLLGGTKSREPVTAADPRQGVPGPEWKTAVTSLAFSPDGKLFAAGDRDGKVRLFDGHSGEPKGVLEGHSGSVDGSAFSRDGTTLFSASQDKTVKFWDVPKGQLLRTLEGHKGAIVTAALSPDGQLLATGGNFAEKQGDKWQTEVILWDTKTGERKRTLSDLAGPVLTLAFSPDGKTLAAGGGYLTDEEAKTTGELRLIPLE